VADFLYCSFAKHSGSHLWGAKPYWVEATQCWECDSPAANRRVADFILPWSMRPKHSGAKSLWLVEGNKLVRIYDFDKVRSHS